VHRNEHTVEIAAPAAAVFPYLADGERRLRWMGVLVETEALTEGPPAVGSRWRDVFEDHGRRIELESELTEYVPDELLQVHIVSRGFEATSTQRLVEASGRTRLNTVIDTEYKLLAARVLGPVVRRHAQRQLEADLAGLKEIVEREAG
jgi:uncharacterized protein YndB with AHSA1/START domain